MPFLSSIFSEMFGLVQEVPQTENTLFILDRLMDVPKFMHIAFTVNYRESYNLHATNGILFNHESPRRGETFVTRKITRAANSNKKWAYKKIYT